ASQQTITITAKSAANSLVTATATVSLQPVGVKVGPSSASLAAGQSTTFTASVTGTTNTAVTWWVRRAGGWLVDGFHPAPATISSSETVTITAKSVADSTKSASATVSLQLIGLTLGPSSASLTGGQTPTFKTTVTGTS